MNVTRALGLGLLLGTAACFHATPDVQSVPLVDASVASTGWSSSNPGVTGDAYGYRTCYEKGLATDPSLRGSVHVTVSIAPTGDVLAATPTNVEGLPPEVVDCVTARLSNTKFQPPGGDGASIDVPFSFGL